MTQTIPLRAALYARVSTADQHNEIQVRELSSYCERRGWTSAEVYQDQISGSKASRPALDRLMADARLRRFDVVLVWKLDRFGRSLIHCAEAIQELASCGVRFVAISQGIDTDQQNPTSRLLMHILASVAEFERELIRERVHAGLAHARREGKELGRPRRIFNREAARELRRQGRSWEQIAAELGVSSGSVRRACAEVA